MHPAIGIDGLGRALRLVPITLHHRIAPGAQLSLDAGGHDLAGLVDDLAFHMGVDASDGGDAALQRIAVGGLERDRAGFRHAVGDGDVGEVHIRDALLHHLDRAGGARHDTGAECREIEALEFRVLQHADEHGRHAVDRGAFFARDRLETRVRVEAFGWKHHG